MKFKIYEMLWISIEIIQFGYWKLSQNYHYLVIKIEQIQPLKLIAFLLHIKNKIILHVLMKYSIYFIFFFIVLTNDLLLIFSFILIH